ncbi:monocarboxylate transporter 2-like [Brachionichthys hirsutus]|uniref:monocarboxylate transporter 2-like n=1 Tax=Brachionichthys hirsutus TaxID=412623 RepID=UPI003605256A
MSPAPADGSAFRPLDGGWGWMVVFGAHVSVGFAYSIPKVLSIFFRDIQAELGSSFSQVALISSIMLAAMYGCGPISSVLVSRFGSRPVVITGGLMCGISMVISSFGNAIIYLYLCIGIIGGCGLSFNLNASLTIISKYFLAKRPLANGLVMAGSPVFLSFLAPLSQYLLINFGWRGSLLILGGVILNCCVAGALMRPVFMPREPPGTLLQTALEEHPNDSKPRPKIGCIKTLMTLLDFSLFKDRGFIIYLIGSMLFILGAYAPIVFLSNYAISQGIEEYAAAYLLTIMGFVDMLVRPSTGLVANTKLIRPRIQYFFSFAIAFNGTCHLLCPLTKGYISIVAYTVLFGTSFGMTFSLIFECLMDLMGSQRFPAAVGLVTLIECIPMLVGPPVAGLLVDVSGDYKYLFLMCGSVILMGGVFLFLMNIYNYHMLKKAEAAKDMEQNQNTVESQDLMEVKRTTEVEMEQTEPGAKKIETQGDQCPENYSCKCDSSVSCADKG